jgi:hypothetical protein
MCTNNVYIGFWECVEMKRTQVYLTEEQKAALDDIAKMRSISVAEVVRETIGNIPVLFLDYCCRKTPQHVDSPSSLCTLDVWYSYETPVSQL